MKIVGTVQVSQYTFKAQNVHHCEYTHSRLCASDIAHQRFGFMTYKTKCTEWDCTLKYGQYNTGTLF
jgi:hypothetical protein